MKLKKTQGNPLLIPAIFSILLHGAVIGGLALWTNGVSSTPQARQNVPVEVELMDVEKIAEVIKRRKIEDATKGQIVEQDEKRLNDEVPVDARFLSRHNQKVVQETQAKLHGKFKNSDESGGKKALESELGKTAKNEAQDQEQPEEALPTKDPFEDDFLTDSEGVARKGGKPKLKDLMPSFKPGPPPIDSKDIAKGGGEGPSATDDHLKNVRTGMQTMLSTREFVYYSYYNRIKDKLRQYWEPKIKEKMARILRQGRTIASDSSKITRIVIVLDSTGTLVGVQVLSPSGVHDLDEAAIEAFRAAAPFPNPPKGIVDPDGTIKIRWDFILEANSGSGLMNAIRFAKSPVN